MLIILQYSCKHIQTKKGHKTFSICHSQNKARTTFGRKEGKKKRQKTKINHYHHQHHDNKQNMILSQL